MEVASTQVHVRPDGKKLIDVTLRRQGMVPEQAALVVPQFDDDDDSSSSDDGPAIEFLFASNKQNTSGTSNNNEENNHDECADGRSHSQQQQKPFSGEIQWDRVQELQELTNANATLTAEARDLRQQVKALQIQLEAQAPVPGLDVDAVQDILLEKDSLDHDIRDVKIVHQAKTLRTLKRSLQREKQLVADGSRQCKELERANKQFEEEVDTLKMKLQRFQARAAAEKVDKKGAERQPQGLESPTESPSDTSSEGGSWKKLCDELKSKNIALQQELKKTQRALVREVGEDVPLEDIVGNTDTATSGASRRGRAQQIIMLKTKVKQLQTRLATLRPGTSSTDTHDNGHVLDVDQRAQQDLSGLQMHRQKRLDQLTSQRDELQERLHRLTRKYDALKARAQILDREKNETRDKFQVFVDKSRTDDALVDALQRQLETWKTKLHEGRRARTADAPKAAGTSQEERVELERLRRIVAEHKSRAGDRSNGAMPQPSEISQYRAIAVEKERLTEVVRSLKAQLESKEKQIRSLQESHSSSDLALQLPVQAPPPSPSLPPIEDDAALRIPRRPSRIPLPSGKSGSGSVSGPPPPSAVRMEQQQQQLKHEMDALRKTFRDAIREKDDHIAELEQQQLSMTQSGSTTSDADVNAMSQELRELQEENDFLRQEFDKLKTRYEALTTKPPATVSRKKSRSKDK
ncbi:hypothetical protein GN244_ATG18763 [Phytophthora infestans]|uniref:Uncharacterized protein n=1 Tax=Phytophthora infestans TaxID=4787 RepID=A0A833SHC8_PHYIN|nr:hypothetical protein GN244_ATG18763 [Phytophthora infestans]KAF4147661.1 hypothetical protein GN958_ATG03016 [Phytophthora infestans]